VTEFKPLTKEDIANVLAISERTVENWVNDGTLIAPRKLGNRVYWHPARFYEWLDATLSKPTQTEEMAAGQIGTTEPPALSSLGPCKGSKIAGGRAKNLRARDQAKFDALLND